jgi:hypothetical protein
LCKYREFKIAYNGFAYDTAGFERQLRQCQQNCDSGLWEAQRAKQPWAVALPLRIYPLYQIFYKFRKFN